MQVGTWEKRHQRAKLMTQLMRLRAKIQQLHRLDYESFMENHHLWNDKMIQSREMSTKKARKKTNL